MKKVSLFILISVQIIYSQVEYDPTLIRGATACANCHPAAVAQWEGTAHFKVFSGSESEPAMHRRPETKKILKKLGMKSAKRGVCVDCHFTTQHLAGKKRPRAISGPSCESCHGASGNWIEIHGVYGNDASGGKATMETEIASHKVDRLKNADDNGMIRTSNVYEIAKNCYKCHTVPNEELVNVGGHNAGSEINFSEWLNNDIKHNFLYSNGTENRGAPRDFDIPKRQNKNKVIGLLVDLEYGLRGYAKASSDGAYSSAMQTRIETAIGNLKNYDSAGVHSTYISDAIAITQGIKISIGSVNSLNETADGVKKIAQNLSLN
ncbi:MAG: hypothetical protein ISR83_01825 [Candidatus Marinimicrobia bacterium]|nr:hypothetical protein [Candidatus Neomarinimicrobiota bacterium]